MKHSTEELREATQSNADALIQHGRELECRAFITAFREHHKEWNLDDRTIANIFLKAEGGHWVSVIRDLCNAVTDSTIERLHGPRMAASDSAARARCSEVASANS